MKTLADAEYEALIARAEAAEERAAFNLAMCRKSQALVTRYVTALFEIANHCASPRAAAEAALLGGDYETATAARALVSLAASRGLVLTVEQRPLVPLAMGHYETVVSVRPARERA